MYIDAKKVNRSENYCLSRFAALDCSIFPFLLSKKSSISKRAGLISDHDKSGVVYSLSIS